MMEKKSEIINRLNERIDKLKTLYDLPDMHTPYFHLYNNDTGILIIPGFADTCYKMKDFADFLISKNYSVYNLTIPQLSLIKKEFGNAGWTEWVNLVKEEYLLFKKLFKKIIIAGFSTGAAIALFLSQILNEKDKPDGLIILSPALFVISPYFPLRLQIILMKIYSFFVPYPDQLNNKHLIYMDQVQRKKFENKEKSNAGTIIELMKFMITVRKKLTGIKVPVLMMQSKNDIVISPYGAEWLNKKIKRNNLKFIRLYKSGHPIIIDIEKEKVFEETLKFLKKFE